MALAAGVTPDNAVVIVVVVYSCCRGVQLRSRELDFGRLLANSVQLELMLTRCWEAVPSRCSLQTDSEPFEFRTDEFYFTFI